MDLPDPDRFRGRDWPSPVGDTLALALVGLGEFTTGWVAPSAEAAEHVTVGAVVSGTAEKARRVGDEFDAQPLTYDEFHDGVSRSAYDAVYVLTPNATHETYVRTAADHGKPVLCEKPLAADVAGATAIRDCCREAGVMLQVAYRLQTDPAVRWARSAIRAGAIGDPVHATGTMAQDLFENVSPDPDQWRLDPTLSGGAALIDLGVYPLNTLRFLTDRDPVAVAADTWSQDDRFDAVDEHVAFTVEYEGGLRAACTASQQSDRADRLRLTGTEGTLVLEPVFFGEVTAILYRDDETIEVTFPTVNEMQEQLEYFASHVSREVSPEPDGTHGLEDMETIAAAYESAVSGSRTAVEL